MGAEKRGGILGATRDLTVTCKTYVRFASLSDVPRVSEEQLASTRRRILDGARRAFAEHGYEGATVKILEDEIGLSRGALFHHFADKEAIFLALADEDAAETAATIQHDGLVGYMRGLRDRDPGWLGVQLEITRRLRTDPAFRKRWQGHLRVIDDATRDRLARQQASGSIRGDVPVARLSEFLQLVLDGLILHLATGTTPDDVDAVLDLIESTVRDSPRSRSPRRSTR